jgi:hypothetical protein
MGKPYSSSRSVSTRSGERRFSFEACPKSDGIVLRSGACLAGERENLARDAGQFIPLAITWLVDVAHECMLAVEEKGSRRASLSREKEVLYHAERGKSL